MKGVDAFKSGITCHMSTPSYVYFYNELQKEVIFTKIKTCYVEGKGWGTGGQIFVGCVCRHLNR